LEPRPPRPRCTPIVVGIRRRTQHCAAFLFFSAFFCILGAPFAQSSISDYEITSIKAHLFLEHEGAFSPQDFASLPRGALWNTIIGEGAAGSSSNDLLAVVEVTGLPKMYAAGRTVTLVAWEKRRDGRRVLILKRSQVIGGLSDEGKY